MSEAPGFETLSPAGLPAGKMEGNAPVNVDAILQAILGRGSERFGPIKDLWQKWQQPHGHVSSLFVPGLTGRVLRWLSPRLEAGGKNNA